MIQALRIAHRGVEKVHATGATVSTETFTAANGAAWPADWVTANGAGSNNQAIQGNKGRLVPSGGWASAWRTGVATRTDFDLTVDLKAGTGIVSVGMSIAHTLWNLPDNAHYLRMEVGATEMGYVSIRRHSGSATELTFVYSAAVPHATNGYSVRFQRIGTALQAKIWTAGGSEPGTWLMSTTDPSPPGTLASKPFFGCDVQTDFDNLVM